MHLHLSLRYLTVSRFDALAHRFLSSFEQSDTIYKQRHLLKDFAALRLFSLSALCPASPVLEYHSTADTREGREGRRAELALVAPWGWRFKDKFNG